MKNVEIRVGSFYQQKGSYKNSQENRPKLNRKLFKDTNSKQKYN